MIHNKEEIKQIIPYEEPFLFIDQINKIEDDKISGSYQTRDSDYYFKGHFVNFKIMPGSLVLEALGQISSLLLRRKIGPEHKNYHFLAYGIRSAQFFKPIFPGDKIELNAQVLGMYPLKENKNKIAHIKAWASVKGEIRAECRLLMAIVDKEEFEEKF